MKTFAFIGSHKNAGKTTALLQVYRERLSEGESVCLASTGINGEPVDNFLGHPKPEVVVRRSSFFVSTEEHCRPAKNRFRTLLCMDGAAFGKPYLLCECLEDCQLVLEGPNSRQGIECMKKKIERLLPEVVLLIDGSVDRQFLGRPSICDGFYFSILLSDQLDKMAQAHRLTKPLFLPTAGTRIQEAVGRLARPGIKSLLLDEYLGLRYQSDAIPFLDKPLFSALQQCGHEKMTFYLDGALSRSLNAHVAGHKNLSIVLDNFTLYQDIADPVEKRFLPKVFLLHPVALAAVYLRYETENRSLRDTIALPETIPIYEFFSPVTQEYAGDPHGPSSSESATD